MPFVAALSTVVNTTKALEEVCQKTKLAQIEPADLACVFYTPQHAEAADAILAELQKLQPKVLLGCVGESIIGNDREIERQPALSLWLGKWQQEISLEPFHLRLERTPEGHSMLGWPDGLMQAVPADSALLLLGDPYTFPVDHFLDEINQNHTGLKVLGGMASGTRGPGQVRLLGQDQVYDQGAVGVLLQGKLGLRTIVSQGCRPIGRHYVVTKGKHNVIEEIGGKTALAQLQELFSTLSPSERDSFQQAFHVGVVTNEYKGEFRRGDFLVRNVTGIDQQSGALAITDHVRVGQTIQFHIRDADTADEDLHTLLQHELQGQAKRPAGALVFSCNGRGSRLFSNPNHDAQAIRQEAGAIPLAGFFAAGEIGPISGKNYIHGFTASVALFDE